MPSKPHRERDSSGGGFRTDVETEPEDGALRPIDDERDTVPPEAPEPAPALETGLEDTYTPESRLGGAYIEETASSSRFDQAATIAGMMAIEVRPPAVVTTDAAGPTYGLYRVIEKVGEGAFATVHKATHTARGGAYALKLLRPEFAKDRDIVARFEREASALVRIRHPNIVGLLDFGVTSGGMYFIVTELVEGRSLKDVIEAEGPFPPERTRAYVRQIAQALLAAHSQGFVHRDLKPDNVMIVASAEGDRVKVLDFGLAILKGDSEGHGFAGTPGWVAPEVINGQPAAPAADLYALGALAFEMATGEPPFRGSLTELLVMHTTQPVPDAPALAGDGMWIRGLLEKDPARRPLSAQTVLEALRRLDAPRPEPPPDPGSIGPVPALVKPPKPLWVMVLLAVAIGAGLAVVVSALLSL